MVHSIVDSIWVTPRAEEAQRSLEATAAKVSADVGIKLEYEATYGWVAFVPQRDSDAGALTKYFGAVAADGDDGDREFKCRGIECRQRSTPPFIAEVQEDLIAVLDETRSPEPVCDRLQRALEQLRTGAAAPEELVIEQRMSKPADAYAHATRTVAALERAEDDGRGIQPRKGVAYVVVDDSKRSRDRVRLPDEADDYDAEFYAEELVRAAESVLAPLDWQQDEIQEYVADRTNANPTAFH